jgi:hypothetical protein
MPIPDFSVKKLFLYNSVYYISVEINFYEYDKLLMNLDHRE